MFKGATCRGSYVLGTACGNCERCAQDPMRPVNANEMQIAGNHYGNRDAKYQHWDLVADTGMGYFEGQISKYVCRWRFKNGKQDLEKALHFAKKMQELVLAGRYPLRQVPVREEGMVLVSNFAIAQKLLHEETIILELCACRATEADLERLIMHIGTLLEKSI